MDDGDGYRIYQKQEEATRTLDPADAAERAEYAFDDWAIASMALDLQEEEVHQHFLDRSAWWRNLLDPETRFMRGKTVEGEWAEPFDPRRSDHREGTDYTEGNAWQHTWFVPHDVRGLMEGMGGEAKFLAKLDSLFEMDSMITDPPMSPGRTRPNMVTKGKRALRRACL